MINKSSIGRARLVAKHQSGSTITNPVNDQTKAAYAKANGLIFENGQFFQTDANGVKTVAPVADYALQEFAQKGGGAGGGGLDKASILSGASQVMDTVSSMFLKSNPNVTGQSELTQGLNAGYDMAASVVGKINPLAGTIMKAGGFAADALTAAGIGTDQQTTADKILDSKFLKATPIGLVNAIGASKTQDFSADSDTIEKVGGSYGGTVSDINEATEKAGKKYGLFSSGARKKANRFIDEQRRKQNIMANIASETTDQKELVNMMGDQASNAYAFALQGGYDQRYMRAKEGAKLPEISKFEAELIEVEVDEKITPGVFEEGGILGQVINPTTGQIEEWHPEFIETVDEYKQGGKVEKQLDAPEIENTTQQNIIPEGALHKNKHHMENAEDLTKKGIPVVDENHKQQAEIECNEIIFTKEVTAKLEELYKIYYNEESSKEEKEEAAIEAGKLLTKEIMLNTDDRTGLIDSLKSGGTIKKQKPAYKDWVKTVNPKMLSDNYDLEKAYELLPWEDLETWRNATLTDEVPEGDWWHLRSVADIDDNTIMFLKKGKTAKENPELQGEFDYYKKDLEFQKDWKMVFNKDENRWYYIRRKNTKKD